jgi:hypothetical protein
MKRLMMFVLAVFLLGMPQASWANGHWGKANEIAKLTGLVVPPLVHGQLVVMADARTEVLALADELAPEDATLATLSDYGTRQRAACFYGLWPARLGDAETIFHKCTHGYLAAARAMLMRLQEIAPADTRVQDLATQVELAMLAQNTSLSLCINSAEPFNTAEVVGPDWTLWERDPVVKSFGTVTLLGLLLAVGWQVGWHRRTRRVA